MNSEYKINVVKQAIERTRSILRHPGQLLEHKKKRNCPCCGYVGAFISMRKNLPEMRCPNCASRPEIGYLHTILGKIILI